MLVKANQDYYTLLCRRRRLQQQQQQQQLQMLFCTVNVLPLVLSGIKLAIHLFLMLIGNLRKKSVVIS